MSKTIRVIDLLNKIANGEEVPKRIKHEGLIYNWDITGYLHYEDSHISEKAFLEGYRTDMCLNDEVEIIEEQEEIDIQEIEKLEKYGIQGLEVSGYSMTPAEYLLEDGIEENRKLINKILQWAKQLDKKIKEK